MTPVAKEGDKMELSNLDEVTPGEGLLHDQYGMVNESFTKEGTFWLLH